MATKKTATKATTNHRAAFAAAVAKANTRLTPERERGLLECLRLVYRAELMADELHLGCSDELGDLRNAIAWELADHDGELDGFRELGRAAREVTA